LRWFGATLLVLEISYLTCGNLFLRFGLRQIVNRSVGVAFTRGESHTSVFAGDDWLKAHVDAVMRAMRLA
jgi:hypothetical protein